MQISLTDFRSAVRQYAGKGLDMIYLHWSAGRYGRIYDDDYHVCIDEHGEVYTKHALTDKLEHTWHRNTGSIAVALMCAYDAECYSPTWVDLGSEPPTAQQIDTMAWVIAILSEELDIPIENVMTHAECADIDGYGIGSGDSETRWDLLRLKDYDGEWKSGGFILRGKARWYKSNGR